jgi:hypothetical protein
MVDSFLCILRLKTSGQNVPGRQDSKRPASSESTQALGAQSLVAVLAHINSFPAFFDVQAPFAGDNVYDCIVAGKYEFPSDVDVSDDAKVCFVPTFGCDWSTKAKMQP